MRTERFGEALLCRNELHTVEFGNHTVSLRPINCCISDKIGKFVSIEFALDCGDLASGGLNFLAVGGVNFELPLGDGVLLLLLLLRLLLLFDIGVFCNDGGDTCRNVFVIVPLEGEGVVVKT